MMTYRRNILLERMPRGTSRQQNLMMFDMSHHLTMADAFCSFGSYQSTNGNLVTSAYRERVGGKKGLPQNGRKCLLFAPASRRCKLVRFVGILAVSFLFLATQVTSLPRFHSQHHQRTEKSLRYRPELTIRGGSTKKPSTKQRAKSSSRKETRKIKPEQQLMDKKQAKESIISLSVDLPVVEALLVPRDFPWTRCIQFVSAIALLFSLVGCFKSAGRPHDAAVMNIIHGTTLSSQAATTTPSSLDELLARRLADAAGDVLPPVHLPNAGPLVGVLVSLVVYIAATLFPRWFLPINIWMNHYEIGIDTTRRIQDQLQQGNVVLAKIQVPRDERHLDGKSHVLCPIHVAKESDDSVFYFDLHHKRFYYNPNRKQHQVINGGPTLHSSVPLRQLVTANGLTTKSSLSQAQQQFGSYNTLALPAPTISVAFMTRISSPLAVLQLLGKLLSALEEDLKSSCISLATTLLHHYWNARNSIVSATELSKEVGDSVQSASQEAVWALRPTGKKGKVKWKELSAVELLPGDVFVMNRTATIMPVDALLLDGTCVTNEAVLTGESIPQTKVPLQVDDHDDETCLDMTSSHRHSVLFAGTSLLHCTNNQGRSTSATVKKTSTVPKGSTGARFLALRTGSYSSRGELLRALLARNSNHVGAISNPQTERDALRLIASLSCFAALACASLFYGPSNQNKSTSAFRRVVQCTRIAVASIPSDLPLALSSVAHSCSLRLRQEADVVCSEPGSLLTAAHVEIVVFDKTGTLTADTQALSRVVTPKGKANEGMDDVILAGCHSLVDLKDSSTNQHHFAGDPLDLASLQYVGWTYDRKYSAYQNKVPTKDGPIRLWQIKTFPFDATRRTSSALLLVLYANGNCRLWKIIKGSPEVVGDIVDAKNQKWYSRQTKRLGGQGLRTIAMAASEVEPDDSTATSLFPDGLPDPSTSSDKDFQKMIVQAQTKAQSLHRNDFEGFESSGDTTRPPSFELVGFACFDAAVRPSTRRIVEELKAAKVNVIMLTGDGVDAAISVAESAGLIPSEGSIAVLDLDDSPSGVSNLIVKRMAPKATNNKKKGKKVSGFELDEVIAVTKETVTSLIEDAKTGQCSLAVTGKAAEQLLSTNLMSSDEAYDMLQENLYRFTIFARASPKQKRSVVSNLKDHSGMKVLMCGDGVNDVAAMKVADVGAALLNGYGDEGSGNVDIEDERRLQQLLQRKIGSNRRKRSNADPLSLAGVGNTATASSARIKAEIDSALLEIQEQARNRQEEGEYSVQHMLQDMKASFMAVFRVLKEERKRKKALRKGGGAAARILAEEDSLRRELTKKATVKADTPSANQQSSVLSTIKPGEASLAAAFSCLRPAIDGVEGLMRVGIAAAACASSVQQTIALNCLLSCYNLATLYRDGFRYGKYLWNAELFFGTFIDQAIVQSSTTARPRLSSKRPDQSLFHPTALMSVCSLALMHLMTMTVGVRTANALEKIYAVPDKHVSKVRWKDDDKSRSSTFGALSKALAAGPRPPKTQEKKKRCGLNLLGRPPFKPNYATNVVFFMSIFQNAVSAIMTHTGKPFYGSILESRQLCLGIGASFLFVIAAVTETFPKLNEFLELRSLPSRTYQRRFLALLAIDLLGCFAAKWAIDGFPVGQEEEKVFVSTSAQENAADKEEALLAEEAEENKKLLFGIGIASLAMLVRSLF